MGNKETRLLTVLQVSKIIGVSRVQVVRKIQSAEITARKIGRQYLVDEKDLPGIYQASTKAQEKVVDRAVDKLFKQHGEVMRKLGDA